MISWMLEMYCYELWPYIQPHTDTPPSYSEKLTSNYDIEHKIYKLFCKNKSYFVFFSYVKITKNSSKIS